MCECDCGTVKRVVTEYLRSGHTTSCGCYQKEKRAAGNPKHGGKRTRLYSIWCGIKNRCYNPKNPSYPRYGGRGILLHDEWHDFAAFRAAVGDPPEGTTIDRIDTNKGYIPGNVRWASRVRQGRNTRFNRMETYQGKTMCLADWAETFRIPYGTLLHRMHRGRTFQEAIEMGWDSDIHDERRIRAALAAVETISTAALESGAVAQVVAALRRIASDEPFFVQTSISETPDGAIETANRAQAQQLVARAALARIEPQPKEG